MAARKRLLVAVRILPTGMTSCPQQSSSMRTNFRWHMERCYEHRLDCWLEELLCGQWVAFLLFWGVSLCEWCGKVRQIQDSRSRRIGIHWCVHKCPQPMLIFCALVCDQGVSPQATSIHGASGFFCVPASSTLRMNQDCYHVDQ